MGRDKALSLLCFLSFLVGNKCLGMGRLKGFRCSQKSTYSIKYQAMRACDNDDVMICFVCAVAAKIPYTVSWL